MPEKTNSKPKLRWYQFSLRALLLLVTAFAIFMSWFTVKMQQAAKQKQIVSEITKSGLVDIRYDYEYDTSGNEIQAELKVPNFLVNSLGEDFFATVVAVEVVDYRGVRAKNFEHISELSNLKMLALSGPWMEHDVLSLLNLQKLTHLQRFGVGGASLSDYELKFIQNYPDLQSLSISSDEMTDDGLKHLSGMMNLHGLFLRGDGLYGDGIVYLKNLPKLGILYIESVNLTRFAIDEIANLKELHTLQIIGQKISDADLHPLAQLTQLEKLLIRSPKVTPEGINQLKKTFPKAEVSN